MVQISVSAEPIKTDSRRRLDDALLGWMNDHGAQGIITTDAQLCIQGWNRWLEVRTGKKAKEIIGHNLLDEFPELLSRKLDGYYTRALEGQSGVLSQKLHRFLLEMPVSELDNTELMLQSVRISPLIEKGAVIGTITVIEDVTERVQRESELQRQLEQRAQLLAGESAARNAAERATHRLSYLQMVTDEAFAQLSMDDLLSSTVKTIRNILNCDFAAILLAELNGDLTVRATDGLRVETLGKRVPAGAGFSGLIARERRPRTMEGDFPPSPFTHIVEEEGVQSLSGVPLLIDKRLVGVLCVGTREHRSISDEDLRFMSLVGDRIAAAIERVRLYIGERNARAQAEEANRLKDQFLATVSHELRTPLNAILGWARMLASGRIDEKTSRHAIGVIERNARSQAQLIDDLLDVSRIISGKLRLNISPVEPVTLVQAALDAVSPAAEAKEIKLNTKFDPNVGIIPGDPDRIQQIIWNLLSNAIKFTPNGGHVDVVVTRAPSYIEYSISDTGQGIAPEFLPFVFERFRQADSTDARAHGGLGLGLAIVRHLTELHGGTVRAESEGTGKGATFTLQLPIQPKITTHVAIDETVVLTDDNQQPFDCPPRIKGLRILIVDDEADSLELMTTVLSHCDAEVSTASSAAEAFDAINNDPPDVLISDIQMPGEDGYSLIGRIRSLTSGGQKILAVALTAHANEADKTRALAAGFNVHVRKPVEPTELVGAISSLVRG